MNQTEARTTYMDLNSQHSSFHLLGPRSIQVEIGQTVIVDQKTTLLSVWFNNLEAARCSCLSCGSVIPSGAGLKLYQKNTIAVTVSEDECLRSASYQSCRRYRVASFA